MPVKSKVMTDNSNNSSGGSKKNETSAIESDARSDELQHLIKAKSGFWERWALGLFILLLTLMCLAARLIRYPLLVEARATVVADTTSGNVAPSVTGKLIEIFVNDGQQVKKNDVVAWMAAAANHKEVSALSRLLDSIYILRGHGHKYVAWCEDLPGFKRLGEIQSTYDDYRALATRIKPKKNRAGGYAAIEEALLVLKSRTDNWKRQFMITAPQFGKIVFDQPLHRGQFLKQQQQIAKIVPQGTSLHAFFFLADTELDSVRPGMRVQLRLDNYPYMKYGFLEGVISGTRNDRSKKEGIVTVDLNREPRTTRNQLVNFDTNLNGEAIVIGGQTNLLRQLFDHLADLKL